ncbi:hypothetical protein [Leptolyngbya sp. FACHB-711]|uniref:hypothetical protein n=1 Tax=unclassified Leptolyngbya TaxID=2650499 RepID=UPI001686ED0E|nr:hypothetical protein [Leptolyngbya sp. FACHB-711]MBD2028185.1 hypothetical protein [Leptolyngbya sp. FACHB-711]
MVLLEWLLRLFGVFWILGGLLTLQQARQSNFFDTALEKITQKPEDRLVTRFLWIVGSFTLCSGLGLALASRWALLPLALLLVVQGVYFATQSRRFDRAQDAEAREDAQISSTTRNAFGVSLGVALVAIIAVKLGILR